MKVCLQHCIVPTEEYLMIMASVSVAMQLKQQSYEVALPFYHDSCQQNLGHRNIHNIRLG